MFLFVFYFQGAQGNDPITAGIKLIPLALGMLDRLAAGRHLRRPPRLAHARLAGHARHRRRPRRDDDAAGPHPLLAEHALAVLVGVGSGMFNSPNTAAMMGTVPANRRGIAAGARTLLQNTGAVLSIAFVLAIVTSAVPKSTLFAVFSGLAKGLSEQSSRRSSPTCTSPCGCLRAPRSSARSCA